MKSKKIMMIASVALSILLVIGTVLIIYLCFWSPVNVYGVEYNRGTREINLSGTDISHDVTDLIKLSRLKKANLINTGISTEQYDFLTANLPDCDITWSVPLGDRSFSSDTDNLILEGSVAPSELDKVKYFTQLKTLDARAYPLCDELYNITLGNENKLYECIFETDICGAVLNNSTQKLDISDREIDDISDFYQKLRFFPNLNEIFCGDCKVSDEDMDKLNSSLPNTKVVWLVEFGHWQVRTDIKVFSSLVGNPVVPAVYTKDKGYTNDPIYNEQDFYPLLNYCTELIALDLGHETIRKLDSFVKLTDLEYLDLYAGRFRDLSPLVNFTKLKALSLSECKSVYDLSPLSELKNLEELYIYDNGRVKSFEPISKCTKLRIFYYGNVEPDYFGAAAVRKALPDCSVARINYKSKSMWLRTPLTSKYKKAFANWNKIVTFNNIDDITYSTDD